ncbi:MAG: ABC transporter ATP-binding protein, partial [Microbacterium sp.]
ERVLLLGASGSGKSTLMRGLAGVLGGDEDGEASGSLELDGVAASSARGRAGLVLQDPDAQVVLSRVGDDVAFGCENLGVAREEIWRRVPPALEAVGLDVDLARSTSELSGGQKQRLALAGALAMRPGLLLLDEPTAQLDPAGVLEVRDAVLEATERTGATLVVVEHRLDAWAPHVDRVIVLGGDGILADGAPEEVFRAHAAHLAAAGVWVPTVFGGERPARGTDRAGDPLAPPILRANGLAVARGGRTVAVGVDVAVRPGRAIAVTGPNGAGKTTLALTLAGLIDEAGGEFAAGGDLTPALPERTRPWRRRRDASRPRTWTARELLTRIGMVFQSPEHQLLASSVRAELEIGPRALGLSADEIAARVDPLLDRLRLRRLELANPFTLSGGEKRRLTVAAALATRPRVLVLDEPTFGQDARTWLELAGMLSDLRDEGTALVLVTHDEALVELLADDVLALEAAP